jgi:hypothetical protein
MKLGSMSTKGHLVCSSIIIFQRNALQHQDGDAANHYNKQLVFYCSAKLIPSLYIRGYRQKIATE